MVSVLGQLVSTIVVYLVCLDVVASGTVTVNLHFE